MTPLRTLLDRRESAVLMGILNRTPDSFSDGGRFMDDGAAAAHVEAMMREGALVVDVGAESTRPGAAAVGAAEQLARLGGVVRLAVARGALVSIDTTLPEVAERALRDGARVVNSVSLEPAAELGALAAAHGAALVLMHSRGPMAEMSGFSAGADDAYADAVADVAREWSAAAARALGRGLARESLVLDPGLGFFKNARQSLELCARLDELVALGFPVLVGPSRKSFVTRVAGDDPPAPPHRRLGGSLAAAIACVARGAAIVRTHDVAETRQALAVAAALALRTSKTGRSVLDGGDPHTPGAAARDGGDPHTPGAAARDGGDPHTPGAAARDGGDPHTPGAAAEGRASHA